MQEYTITSDSGMETTVLLSDDDAKARGLKPNEAKAKAPANKQATPANKSAGQSKRDEAVSKSFGQKKSAEG
jgi:hypothetical protein